MAFDLAKIDVEHCLETLELRHVRRASTDEYVFSCPYPAHDDGDNNPSAYMNTGEEQPWKATQWFCHACKQRGDARTLVAYLLDISPIQASRMLREAYDPAAYDPDKVSMVARLREIRTRRRLRAQAETYVEQILDPAVMDDWLVDWDAAHRAWEAGMGWPPTDYLFERGFGPDVLDRWDIGVDVDAQRITIPVRNADGALIGFKGRAWDPQRQPKYLILGDRPNRPGRYGFAPYEQSRVVFGLDRTRGHDTLIIVEGELNVLAMQQAGFSNAVAINGSYFSQDKARLIISHCERAIIFLDSDQAGHECVWGSRRADRTRRPGIVEMLSPHISVFLTPDHDGDPADMHPSQMQRCVEQAVSASRVKLMS